MQDPRFLSTPIQLNWAGWTADTYTLYRHGWEISAEQDPYRQTMRLAIQHQRERAQAITELTEWAFMQNREYMRAYPLPARVHMGRDIQFHVMESPHSSQWGAVDPVPQIRTTERKSLEDYVHFAPAPKPLILPPETVPDLMARILELQQPARDLTNLRNARSLGQIITLE